MATDNSDKQSPDANSGKKSADGMSMKERLLAQRRAEAEGASKPAAAPPVPAARPAQRPATAPARPAAAPAPQAAKSAAAPAEAPAKRPVKLAGAREEARTERGAKKPVSEDVRREIDMLRKRQDKWITYGWMVALGLLLIAGITYYITKSKKDAIEAADKERIEKVKNWVDTVKAFDVTKPSDWEAFDKLFKDPENEKYWKVNTLDSNAITIRIKSTMAKNKEDAEVLKDVINGIAGLEAIASTASSKTAEELEQARRRVALFAAQGSGLAMEQTQRISKSGDTIDRAYIAKLHDDAKSLAGKGPGEMKNALAAYTKAEDEVIKLLDEATKKKVEEQKTYYMGHYRDMITECDALVAVAFTPDVIEKTPWTDLLSGAQKDNWQQAGFTGWQLKDGVLQGNTDLGAKSTSVMSIGDREQWRDYVLEVEFAVAKGEPVLHCRLGRTVNNTTINYTIGTTGQNAFKPGSTNTITATVIGSSAKVAFSDPDRSPGEETLNWTTARKGGIGVSVPAGSDIKITKMRIKALR
jgi:hypothetical protein